MQLKLDLFTITIPKGATCSLQKIKEHNNISEYEFAFSWTKENAVRDDIFSVSWQGCLWDCISLWVTT